jgi:hypothetical protein
MWKKIAELMKVDSKVKATVCIIKGGHLVRIGGSGWERPSYVPVASEYKNRKQKSSLFEHFFQGKERWKV